MVIASIFGDITSKFHYLFASGHIALYILNTVVQDRFGGKGEEGGWLFLCCHQGKGHGSKIVSMPLSRLYTILLLLLLLYHSLIWFAFFAGLW